LLNALTRRNSKGAVEPKEREKTMIYKYLSHHYVLRRSVVFIVDTEYTSVIYHDKANKYVKKFFKQLDPEDYFGYISLGKKGISDQSVLQKKEDNTQLQYKFLQMMSEREPDLLLQFQNMYATGRRNRLA